MITYLKRRKLLFVLTVIFVASCTDLTETVHNQVTADNFFQTDEEFISALGDAYGPLSMYGGNWAINVLQEVTTDAVVVAQKGADWEDGGVWIRMHRQTFRPSDDQIGNTWNELFNGISNANRLIFQFEQVLETGSVDQAAADVFIGELQAVRAFYYYQLLDNYGNVPIVTSFVDSPENPSQPSSDFAQGRRAVFDFVEEELLSVLDRVDTNVNDTIGRVNRWVVHMTLAKLYLNAEVYIGEPRWNDVINHTDAIIDSGNFNLTPTYAENFSVDNTGSPEHIFTVLFDEIFLGGHNLHMMTNHILSQPAFGFADQPWNGFQTVADFYESYIDPDQNPGPQGDVVGMSPTGDITTGTQDSRLSHFLVGPLLDLQGNPITDPGVESSDPVGPEIVHTPYINELAPGGWRQAGARIHKYEVEIGMPTANMNNDLVIYRYADVLLMKAEALWRLNPGDAIALMLVNEIRNRAGVDAFDSLTEERLLAERGREMFWENFRRQDMIRFDGNSGLTRYNDPWWEKNQSEPYRNVFPIPQGQLEANPNLVQNPGY